MCVCVCVCVCGVRVRVRVSACVYVKRASQHFIQYHEYHAVTHSVQCIYPMSDLVYLVHLLSLYI